MKINIVNFASGRFVLSQKIQNLYWSDCYPEAVVHSFNREDLLELRRVVKRKQIIEVLNVPRGDGLWAWKLLFINVVFSKCETDDVVLYLDSGGLPIGNVDYIFDLIRAQGNFFAKVDAIEDESVCRNWLRTTNKYSSKQHLIDDGGLFLHKKWDKRHRKNLPDDLVQTAGGVQGWLVNHRNKEIINYLTDQISLSNYDDYTEITSMDYIDHRHDQSVLSEFVEVEKLFVSPTMKNVLWHKGNVELEKAVWLK